MIDLTAGQLSVISGQTTSPIYLIDLEYSGLEYLSTSGDREVGSIQYSGGDIGVMGMDNWTRASLKLRPTPARVASLTSNGWRNQTARIWLLPAVQYPTIIQSGYVESGYAAEGYRQDDPVLLLDGVIVNAGMTDVLELSVSHRAFVNKWTPRLRINNVWANHLPQAGTRFLWEGDNYILESR